MIDTIELANPQQMDSSALVIALILSNLNQIVRFSGTNTMHEILKTNFSIKLEEMYRSPQSGMVTRALVGINNNLNRSDSQNTYLHSLKEYF